jgi:predicted phage terminase large subunit-like protein
MRTRWAVAADRFDPPTEIRDADARTALARSGPVGFASIASRGQWEPAPHLEFVAAALAETVDNAGRLVVSLPTRHGKSTLIARWLPAWYLATHPNRRVILCSHEADFAATHGRFVRDTLNEWGHLFDVSVSKRSDSANRWDIAGRAGGMLTVGRGGTPIGRGADLLIVDDPFRNFEDAMSPLIRKRVHDWQEGTLAGRVEPGGCEIVLASRWHEDDLSGWLLANDPQWRELRLPAIAETDDPLGRAEGEALWPGRWPLAELERRRAEVSLSLGDQIWSAQYQQTPRSQTGGLFPSDKWGFSPARPVDVERWVRGWDLAATEAGGDWTVGALVGQLPDGRFVVADVRRGQWSPDDVRSQLKATAHFDPPGTHVELPQDPGQAGKDQAQQLIRLLAGTVANSQAQSGSKEVRAAGFSAQQRAGNVLLVDGDWVGSFVAECEQFPRGVHDDQVDAAAIAFNRLCDPLTSRRGGLIFRH